MDGFTTSTLATPTTVRPRRPGMPMPASRAGSRGSRNHAAGRQQIAGGNQPDRHPGVCDRSWTAAVGRPPLKKNAAILPSFSASADSSARAPAA